MAKKPTGKPRGRPSNKIKLKHNPKSSRQDFLKKFKDIDSIGIYGVDKFTTEIINHLWENPEISFHVTDSNRSRLDNSNKLFGQRSFSMYRWNVYPESGFIEQPVVDIILVSKDCWEEVNKRPNPYGVELLLLEEI
jgi:hypothetical protein